MDRIFKKLLVCLLVALLPLQAVAGSFGLTCAPVHRQSSQDAGSHDAGMQDVGDHAVVGHEMQAGSHAGHGAGQAQQASNADGDAPADHAGKLSHSSCSACSAFCLGAVAPPSSHLPAPAFDGSDAVIVAPPVFAVAFLQDGPQRPPRH